MPRVLRRALLLAALLVAQGAALAEVPAGMAEEMVRKSGLWEQLGSVAPQVKAAFAEVASKGGSPLAAGDAEQLGRIADAAYAPAKLRATAVGAVRRSMTADQAGELRAWYDSDRGKAIAAAEEAMSKRTDSPEDAVREGMRVLAAATTERRATIERISVATRAPEAMANLAINTAVAIQQGVIRAQGQQGAPSPAELRAAFAAQKPQMMQAYAGLALASFALSYADIAEADLAAYAAFLESKSGLRFTGQCLLAFDQALTQAGREFGQGLSAARPRATT